MVKGFINLLGDSHESLMENYTVDAQSEHWTKNNYEELRELSSYGARRFLSSDQLEFKALLNTQSIRQRPQKGHIP